MYIKLYKNRSSQAFLVLYKYNQQLRITSFELSCKRHTFKAAVFSLGWTVKMSFVQWTSLLYSRKGFWTGTNISARTVNGFYQLSLEFMLNASPAWHHARGDVESYVQNTFEEMFTTNSSFFPLLYEEKSRSKDEEKDSLVRYGRLVTSRHLTATHLNTSLKNNHEKWTFLCPSSSVLPGRTRGV